MLRVAKRQSDKYHGGQTSEWTNVRVPNVRVPNVRVPNVRVPNARLGQMSKKFWLCQTLMFCLNLKKNIWFIHCFQTLMFVFSDICPSLTFVTLLLSTLTFVTLLLSTLTFVSLTFVLVPKKVLYNKNASRSDKYVSPKKEPK